jgi:Kef-type K+ transport system membrane component KefB
LTAHADPVALVALGLAVILATAKVGGHLAERVGQPAVLGELLVGIILGNLGLVGIPWLEPIKADATLDILARLGVIILLFEVGLESTVREMLHVGGRSLVVAALGVAVPWVLGWGVGALLLPDRSVYVHLFLGAVLTATSVGITARVLRDLGRSRSAEARIILGAAVIDDVLGLVILAVVAGIIAAADVGTALSAADIAAVLGGRVPRGSALARPQDLAPSVPGQRAAPRRRRPALHGARLLLRAGLARRRDRARPDRGRLRCGAHSRAGALP